jgi:hypothetical protein
MTLLTDAMVFSRIEIRIMQPAQPGALPPLGPCLYHHRFAASAGI